MLPLLLMSTAALADCMGTRDVISFAAISPPDPTVFVFPDDENPVDTSFEALDQEGRQLPLRTTALPMRGGGLPGWRLEVETSNATRTVQVVQRDGPDVPPRLAATLQIRAPGAAVGPPPTPIIRGVRWSRYAWMCSHEDALWLSVDAGEGVLAWELTLPSGEVLVLPPTPQRFFGRPPHADDEIGLGEINCMLSETLSWAEQPQSPWTFTLRAWYANGQRSPPVSGAVDVHVLRADG